MIDCFDGKNAFLSNFYETPVTYDGITFRSSEAAYQAAKAADPAMREQFKDLIASDAKHLGRAITVRGDWEAIKFHVMRAVVHAKFSQAPTLATQLVNTDAEMLVEGNCWHDSTYGDCRCPKCANIPGQNILGNILMLERAGWRDAMEVRK